MIEWDKSPGEAWDREELWLQDTPQKFLDHKLAVLPHRKTLQLVLGEAENQHICKSQSLDRVAWKRVQQWKAGLPGAIGNQSRICLF